MNKSIKYLTFSVLLISAILFTSAYVIVNTKSVTISPVKMNIFYIGVDNPVSIYASGVESKNLIVKGSYGTSITKDTSADGRYLIRVNETGKATITVSVKTDQGVKVLFTQDFSSKKLPDPTVFFGTHSGDALVEPDELTTPNELVCKMDDVDFPCVYYIQSFVMSVNHNGEWTDYTSAGPELTSEMKSELANSVSGSRVFFHDVFLKGSDGVVRKLKGVNLTLH